MTNFGKNLRLARIARNITQQALSDQLNIALRTYQCYEQGTREPSLSMLVMIGDALNVPVDYLLGRELDALKSFDGFR